MAAVMTGREVVVSCSTLRDTWWMLLSPELGGGGWKVWSKDGFVPQACISVATVSAEEVAESKRRQEKEDAANLARAAL